MLQHREMGNCCGMNSGRLDKSTRLENGWKTWPGMPIELVLSRRTGVIRAKPIKRAPFLPFSVNREIPYEVDRHLVTRVT